MLLSYRVRRVLHSPDDAGHDVEDANGSAMDAHRGGALAVDGLTEWRVAVECDPYELAPGL